MSAIEILLISQKHVIYNSSATGTMYCNKNRFVRNVTGMNQKQATDVQGNCFHAMCAYMVTAFMQCVQER